MAMRVHYSVHIVDGVSASSNVDISDRVRAYQLSVKSQAEQGSVALSQIVVDDPDGGINILGLRGVTVHETEETVGSQLVYKGWTADRDIARGPSMLTGTSRRWSVNLADQNSIINRRIMRGADANRPAETDVERIQWLQTTTEFGALVLGTTLVSTASPVAMDAVDYRNQRNQDILDDCSQASGKNFFLVVNDPSERHSLFYDFASSSAYPSTLQLSNVLADVDSVTTFAVSEADTLLNRDPSRVYSGIILPYDGGEVYVTDPAIATAYQPRDTLAPAVNVRSHAKALARATRYLSDAATESDNISTSFLVPNAKVNHLKEGMAVLCKFSHLPGYESYSWMRALSRTVTATSEEFYTVGLELTPSHAAASCASPTATGSFGPNLSGTSAGTGNVLYLKPGTENPRHPTPGFAGAWNFADFNLAGIDYGGDCAQNTIRLVVVGDGTITINTAIAAGGTREMTATLFHYLGEILDTATTDATTVFQSGDTIAMNVSSHGGTFCTHIVDIIVSDFVTCGGGFGFSGFSWVAA